MLFATYFFGFNLPLEIESNISIDKTLGFILLSLKAIVFLFILIQLRRVLLEIRNSNYFSESLLGVLDLLKYGLFICLAFPFLKLIYDIIHQQQFSIGIDENFLFILVSIIFINIYQQSIKTYKEHQLTI